LLKLGQSISICFFFLFYLFFFFAFQDLGHSCEVEDKEMAPALEFFGSPVKCTRDRFKAGGVEKITVFQCEKMTVSGPRKQPLKKLRFHCFGGVKLTD
jgi:hypothetical protein